VQADPAQWKDALSKLVIYGILSPWDAELSDMLNRIKTEKKLEQLPAIKSAHSRHSHAQAEHCTVVTVSRLLIYAFCVLFSFVCSVGKC